MSTVSKWVAASMTSTSPPNRTPATLLKAIIRATATGSARPLASTMTASRLSRGSASRVNASSIPPSSGRTNAAAGDGGRLVDLSRHQHGVDIKFTEVIDDDPDPSSRPRSTWLRRLVLPAPEIAGQANHRSRLHTLPSVLPVPGDPDRALTGRKTHRGGNLMLTIFNKPATPWLANPKRPVAQVNSSQ